MKECDVNEVEHVMGEIQEIQDDNQEINEALGRPIGEEYDEEDLENELNELDNLDMEEMLEEFPVVPQKNIKKKNNAFENKKKVNMLHELDALAMNVKKMEFPNKKQDENNNDDVNNSEDDELKELEEMIL